MYDCSSMKSQVLNPTMGPRLNAMCGFMFYEKILIKKFFSVAKY